MNLKIVSVYLINTLMVYFRILNLMPILKKVLLTYNLLLIRFLLDV